MNGLTNNNSVLNSHSSRTFETGDKVRYENQDLIITGIVLNTDGHYVYSTNRGSRNGDAVDATGYLVDDDGTPIRKEIPTSSGAGTKSKRKTKRHRKRRLILSLRLLRRAKSLPRRAKKQRVTRGTTPRL